MVVCTSNPTYVVGLGRRIMGQGCVMCRFEVLQAGVESPCLYRPENWLLRQLIDEPKLVYEVGFIREKGKATARTVQRSLETGSFLLR
jgi:hypothetical protein